MSDSTPDHTPGLRDEVDAGLDRGTSAEVDRGGRRTGRCARNSCRNERPHGRIERLAGIRIAGPRVGHRQSVLDIAHGPLIGTGDLWQFVLERLARHFGLARKQAEKRFTRRYRDADSDERRCTVQEARPTVCRQYPNGRKCGYYDFIRFERKHQDEPEFIPSA